MRIGYARVSTSDQKFDLQIDALEKSGCDKIFKEVVGGVKTEKKELNELLKQARENDTLVVWRLDRLGRSLKDLILFINNLKEKKIFFKSIVESIDTSTPTGEFFFHITGAFAQLERNLIHERTMAGLVAARARGRLGGRPKVIDKETLKVALSMYETQKIPISDICDRLKIKQRSFYRYLSQYKAVNR
ncbi:MAG: recombinase family protein [Oligoflexia bacterium]|nr:recombinase family protein [Oligoflexia bacterium]